MTKNATYQRETLSERPIRQPLIQYFIHWYYTQNATICQIKWFTLSLLQTTDRNDRSTKSMAYHNSEQVISQGLN